MEEEYYEEVPDGEYYEEEITAGDVALIVGIVIAATIMIIPVSSFTASAGSCLINIVCIAVGIAAALMLDKFNQKFTPYPS